MWRYLVHLEEAMQKPEHAPTSQATLISLVRWALVSRVHKAK
jgi:hypothetical protein